MGRYSTNLKGTRNLARELVKAKRDNVYPLVFQLFKLALLLPMAIATVERAFPAMKIVKKRVQNRIGIVVWMMVWSLILRKKFLIVLLTSWYYNSFKIWVILGDSCKTFYYITLYKCIFYIWNILPLLHLGAWLHHCTYEHLHLNLSAHSVSSFLNRTYFCIIGSKWSKQFILFISISISLHTTFILHYHPIIWLWAGRVTNWLL